MNLNGNSVTPLYQQLKEAIVNDIQQGKYKAGEKLPTEQELCEMYSVSRITTRRAVLDLVDEGILKRLQGKGTFVMDFKMKTELVTVGGWTETIKETGKTPGSRVLSSEIILADEMLSDRLCVPIGDAVLKLHRLLFIDEEPIILDTSYYSTTKFPDLDKKITNSSSVYAFLREEYKVEFVSLDRTIDVIHASNEQAELLQCEVGDTLYKIKKTVYDRADHPINTSDLLAPTGRITLSISRKHDSHS